MFRRLPTDPMLSLCIGLDFVLFYSGEYGNVFRRLPTDPMLSLCIGLDFVHIASQRFAAKRQAVVTQVICKFSLAHEIWYLSRVMRKLAFCICENKGADQLHGNRAADQRLCFPYIDCTIPLLPTSEISSL